ncbi:FAD-dependent oxidoreductase [Variovorax sp. J2P1-59]|uniref:FAD-dependent oxidoreductase n=1 Tax=Variovorax flavidus TaxID=3053501 RepID=UPI0025763408|nr:FAD-dependent oxidoreductase [Variovorax sp. J2P1-59]MDM0078326.1 FAD-dependent oxidoreductase [Variovorax sp. J2P1-59]
MRVVVLGAGLLGVTSAYYLQQLGHEVIVVDRHATPAAKARGRVAPAGGAATLQRAGTGLAHTAGRAQGGWARLRAGMRRRVAKLLDHAIGARAPRDPREHLVRLAAYSRKSARVLRDEAGLPQGSRIGGLLNVFTDVEAFNARLARAPHWSGLGCEEQLFSPDDAIRMEPALQAIRTRFAGATYSVEDPARDPSQVAASLVFLCRAAGVRFLTKHTVVSLKDRDGRIDRVELLDPAGQPMTLRAQAYVLALGASSVPHAEYLGVDMPLRFVREYIVTIPVKDAARAPRVALRDVQGKLRITRVESPEGDQLRVTATVRAGLDEDCEPDSDRFNAILARVEMLLPGAADMAHASLATEMHAVSTTRLPMIGKTRLPNLFINTAPGTPSWINALGAGKSIARIVSGLRPELQFAFRGL